MEIECKNCGYHDAQENWGMSAEVVDNRPSLSPLIHIHISCPQCGEESFFGHFWIGPMMDSIRKLACGFQ